MRVSFARVAMLGTVAVAAIITTPAQAQDTNPPAAAPPEAVKQAPSPKATAAPDNGGKDSATGEIVVTARRTEERLQRVPASVSALDDVVGETVHGRDRPQPGGGYEAPAHSPGSSHRSGELHKD